LLLLSCDSVHRDLHSFPTRRSSDLRGSLSVTSPYLVPHKMSSMRQTRTNWLKMDVSVWPKALTCHPMRKPSKFFIRRKYTLRPEKLLMPEVWLSQDLKCPKTLFVSS